MKRYFLAASVLVEEEEILQPIICHKAFKSSEAALSYFKSVMLKALVIKVLEFHQVEIGDDIDEEELNELISEITLYKNECQFSADIGDLYIDSVIKIAIEEIEI